MAELIENNSTFGSLYRQANFREADFMKDSTDSSSSLRETSFDQLGINRQAERASRESCFIVLLVNSLLWSFMSVFSAILMVQSDKESDEYRVLKQLFIWLCILVIFFVSGLLFLWLSRKSKRKAETIYNQNLENFVYNIIAKNN